MEKIKTYDNLKKIIQKSYEWRHRDLSNSTELEIKINFFSKFNFILLSISILLSCYLKEISDDLVNAILTFTSIFATLIIPVLILVYDKFCKNPNSHLTDLQSKSEGALERYKLHKNFTNRYIFVTLENIIISILIIILILIYKSFLTNYLSVDVMDYKFVKCNYESVIQFSQLFVIMSFKTFFAIFVIKFIYFLFFSIGAIGDFFISVLNEQ